MSYSSLAKLNTRFGASILIDSADLNKRRLHRAFGVGEAHEFDVPKPYQKDILVAGESYGQFSIETGAGFQPKRDLPVINQIMTTLVQEYGLTASAALKRIIIDDSAYAGLWRKLPQTPDPIASESYSKTSYETVTQGIKNESAKVAQHDIHVFNDGDVLTHYKSVPDDKQVHSGWIEEPALKSRFGIQ